MLKALKIILNVQEVDMQMIQLMRLKTERQKDLANINAVKTDLNDQAEAKESDISDLKKLIRLMEGELTDVKSKIKKLEAQQSSIKKVEEFNALSHEMSQADRDRGAREQRLSDHMDRLVAEEDALKAITENLKATTNSSKVLEAEIQESIDRINAEGRVLKAERDQLVVKADPEIFRIYERLLRNKKDRVVVPIENRCCSGCHIMLTAQDENLVRKGERLVFCEHCSRIHFWQESEALEGTAVATKQRRRRASV
ncbi:MAG TPA: zinc ribbon domain-containing protein [Parachlamydiaceae bacterium]|nr:zinc ribbon domain-containing protein [Parachlamydiaceae bacterium]